MPTTACNGNGVEDFKEIEVEFLEQLCCGTLFCRYSCPAVIRCLCLTEYIVNATRCVQQGVDICAVALVCKLQLVFKVVEAVVYGSSRKHKYFGLYAFAYNLVEQTRITILALVALFVGCSLATVAEIVALVDNDKVIVSPIYLVKVVPVGNTVFTR